MAHAELEDTLPPAPTVRHLTPAPEAYSTRPPLLGLLWPCLWFALLVALVVLAVVGSDPNFHT